MKVSIFELVVGDIVQLNIGDQVSISKSFPMILSHFTRNLTNFLAVLWYDETVIGIAGHLRLKRVDG